MRCGEKLENLHKKLKQVQQQCYLIFGFNNQNMKD